METQTDPVCGMQVDEQHSAGTLEFNNKTYYICSQDCKQKFGANPERYVGEAA
jgi:Cu+-exporting ATPase